MQDTNLIGQEQPVGVLTSPVPVPTPTMTLCSYGTKLTREELARVVAPAATATHKPIPHIAVGEKLIEALGFRQIGVVREEYAVCQKLGVGAHLASLRRTAVAEFRLEDAHTLDRIAEAGRQHRFGELTIHLRRILPNIPSVTADDDTVGKIRHGRSVNLAEFSRSKWVKVFAGQSDLICLASRVAGSLFHPKVVLG